MPSFNSFVDKALLIMPLEVSAGITHKLWANEFPINRKQARVRKKLFIHLILSKDNFFYKKKAESTFRLRDILFFLFANKLVVRN
jgi:hypothetical protein